MLRILIIALAASTALVAEAVAQSQTDVMSKVLALDWIKAPASAPIAGVAHIKLTNGEMALGDSDTSRFLQLNGNPPSSNEFVVSAPELLNYSELLNYELLNY